LLCSAGGEKDLKTPASLGGRLICTTAKQRRIGKCNIYVIGRKNLDPVGKEKDIQNPQKKNLRGRDGASFKLSSGGLRSRRGKRRGKQARPWFKEKKRKKRTEPAPFITNSSRSGSVDEGGKRQESVSPG